MRGDSASLIQLSKVSPEFYNYLNCSAGRQEGQTSQMSRRIYLCYNALRLHAWRTPRFSLFQHFNILFWIPLIAMAVNKNFLSGITKCARDDS